MLGDGLSDFDNGTDVWFFIDRKWSWDANQDDVTFFDEMKTC